MVGVAKIIVNIIIFIIIFFVLYSNFACGFYDLTTRKIMFFFFFIVIISFAVAMVFQPDAKQSLTSGGTPIQPPPPPPPPQKQQVNMCTRNGCGNIAVSCPDWDDEYCSFDCCYQHCKWVFCFIYLLLFIINNRRWQKKTYPSECKSLLIEQKRSNICVHFYIYPL